MKNWFRLRSISPIWLLIGFGLFLLWTTPLIYPLKLFVVFLHELSHGMMAVATGGRLDHFVVNGNEGGHAISIGGSRFLILSAGYLGSLMWGGLILLIAARTNYDKALSVSLGLVTVLITLVFTRNTFGIAFGMLFGTGLILAGKYVRESINDWMLRTIGFATCIYAILDIASDVLWRSALKSDARMLAELTGIPTLIWGSFWILLAIVGTGFFLSLASRANKLESRSSTAIGLMQQRPT